VRYLNPNNISSATVPSCTAARPIAKKTGANSYKRFDELKINSINLSCYNIQIHMLMHTETERETEEKNSAEKRYYQQTTREMRKGF